MLYAGKKVDSEFSETLSLSRNKCMITNKKTWSLPH